MRRDRDRNRYHQDRNKTGSGPQKRSQVDRNNGERRRDNNGRRRDYQDENTGMDLERPGRLSPYPRTLDRLSAPATKRSEQIKLRRYGVIFFDTLAAAKAQIATIKSERPKYDQLNIVIRAESPMDDPELGKFGKVFAGAAWALIHDRRVSDGWYNEPHE